MAEFNIQIPSIIENIRVIESFIDNVKDKVHITDDIYGNIMISVTESVTNAIKHGNKEDSKKTVTLNLKVEGKNLHFSVEDQGEGFNHEILPDPTAPENLEKTSGRGIFIIKSLCDDVSFENEGRKVNLTFVTA